MTKDQSYGGLIFGVSVIVAIAYLFSLTSPALYAWAIGIPVVLAVLAILGITAWIGWTMLTTPPPAPLETEMPSASSTTPTSTTNQATTSGMHEDK